MQSNRETLSRTSEVSMNTLIAYSLGAVTNIRYAHTTATPQYFIVQQDVLLVLRELQALVRTL